MTVKKPNCRRSVTLAVFVLSGLSFVSASLSGASPTNIAINEIAWIGTATSPNDEWLLCVAIVEAGDLRILEAMIKKFNRGPVSLQALSAATSEEIETVLTVYEPYLLRLGFIERTPQRRIATKNAYQYLHIKYPKDARMFI